MKWANIGHEYDKSYENIEKIDSLYLWGAGHDGEMVYDILTHKYPGMNIIGFIDNDINKQGKKYAGKKIFSPSEIVFSERTGIVICFASEYIHKIDNQLAGYGYKKNINFWHYEEFLSVYAAYKYNEVFFSSICILPTTTCNLRCKSCLNFTNYISKFENRDIDKLTDEIDLYFNSVNYTGLFFISGGEPLLYPKLKELIEYIGNKYRTQIYEFGIVSNGTVCPSEELLNCIEHYQMIITIDDYRNSLPDRKNDIDCTIDTVTEKLSKSRYLVRKYDEWISLYPHKIDNLCENELIAKYDACHCPWQEYRDGKLFSCNYASFADVAKICIADVESETYDLRNHSEEKIKEIIEFRLGFSKKGYVEFCKKCAAYLEINPYKVKAAEQEDI